MKSCREAEAAAAAAEAERQRAEEEARRQAEEARAAKEAEKRELRRLERKFTVRLLGRAEVARPDKVGAACFAFCSLHRHRGWYHSWVCCIFYSYRVGMNNLRDVLSHILFPESLSVPLRTQKGCFVI